MSHFFAYLSRMKFIRRWGLMYSTYPENIQEHSLRVAMIAHALALIRNQVFGGDVNPDRTAVLALYHDASEVFTGDLPTPVKYFNPEIKQAYGDLEEAATQKLLSMLPPALQETYEAFLVPGESDREHAERVKAADKLCAYLKCVEEMGTGNREFAQAEKAIAEKQPCEQNRGIMGKPNCCHLSGDTHENPEVIICPTASHLPSRVAQLPFLRRPACRLQLPQVG